MILAFSLLFVLFCECNWNQFGHDERNTFQSNYVSKNTEGWYVYIDGYKSQYTDNWMMIDDNTGVVWLINQCCYDYHEGQHVTGINQNGTVIFTTLLKCNENCGGPILSSDGSMIYYSNLYTHSINSVSPNGTIDWYYGTYCDFSAVITSDDLFIFTYDHNEIFCEVSSVKLDGQDVLWKLNTSSRKHFRPGYYSISGDQIYFSDAYRPINLWILDAHTGEIISKKYYSDGNDETTSTKLTVDKKNSQIYFMDNWSDIPRFVALKDPTLDHLWNFTVHKGLLTSLGAPILTFPDDSKYPLGLLITMASIWDRDDPTSFILLVDPNVPDVEKKIIQDIKLSGDNGGCDGMTLLDNRTIVTTCSPNSDTPQIKTMIQTIDIFTGEIKVIKRTDENESIVHKAITDSSGCIYFVTVRHESPLFLHKKCL